MEKTPLVPTISTSEPDDGQTALAGLSYAASDDAPDDPDAGQPINAAGDIIAPDAPEVSTQMTKDTFWAAFKGLFAFSAAMFPDGGLPEFAIQPSEEAHGRMASDASFDLILSVAPSWLEQGNEKLGSIVVMVSFFAMKGKILVAAIELRKQKVIAAQASRTVQHSRPAQFKSDRTSAPQSAPQHETDPRAEKAMSDVWEVNAA